MPRTLAALALARSEKMHNIPSREAMLRIEADYEQLAKRIEERAHFRLEIDRAPHDRRTTVPGHGR
jgi:hypothetical protein